jgi:hypothetical protein
MHALAVSLALSLTFAQGSLSVGPQQKVLSPTPAANRLFGLALTAQGDRAGIVESWGTAFVREFQRSGASWSFAQSTTLLSDLSPVAVDVDGEWMVLGDPESGFQGVVRVYRRVNGVWQHFQELVMPHNWNGFSEYWGFCVDVDGNRLAVGNPVDAEYGSAVYVWKRSSAFWSLEGVVRAEPPAYGNMGAGVALRGDELLVSSRNKVEYHRFIPASGRWVFQYDVLSGLNGPTVLSRIPLAINDDGSALVGNPYDDTAGNDAGAVHALERVGGVWGVRATLFATTPLPGAQFGYSVACQGPLLAVGAPGANSAELIVRNAGWQSAAVVTATDSLSGDRFGEAVAIATTPTNLGASLLAGSPFHDAGGNNAGAAYFFEVAHSAAVYCTSKVNSLGCLPRMGFSGVPSASSPTPFTVVASSVLNQRNGVFFYGLSGPAAAPFQGGLKCVSSPTRRTGTLNSGGTPPIANDCSGVYGFDFNAWIGSGADPSLVPGVSVRGQFWSRDPAASFGVGLSEAIEFLIQN